MGSGGGGLQGRSNGVWELGILSEVGGYLRVGLCLGIISELTGLAHGYDFMRGRVGKIPGVCTKSTSRSVLYLTVRINRNSQIIIF